MGKSQDFSPIHHLFDNIHAFYRDAIGIAINQDLTLNILALSTLKKFTAY